jgi:tRNA(fMet)-specific endonuclease VapC
LRYLLDTNVVSEPLRPRPDARTLDCLRAHQGEIALPSLVWHELQYGCARLPRSRRRRVIERYLSDVVSASFPILDYDRAAAEWHARQRARLAARGRSPSFVDGQIAGIAATNSLVLVTFNTKDFQVFEELDLEDWRTRDARS